MKKTRKTISDLLAGGILDRVLSLKEPDLIILRGHGLVEATLFSLLARRLRVTVGELPSINNFELLPRLALSGEVHTGILDSVLKLNKMRNIVAHEVESVNVDSLMRNFVATMPERLAHEARQNRSDISLSEIFYASVLVVLYALLRLPGETLGE